MGTGRRCGVNKPSIRRRIESITPYTADKKPINVTQVVCWKDRRQPIESLSLAFRASFSGGIGCIIAQTKNELSPRCVSASNRVKTQGSTAQMFYILNKPSKFHKLFVETVTPMQLYMQ